MSLTNFFFKVELEHDAQEDRQRIGEEIRRYLTRIYGVRDVELSHFTPLDE